MIALSLCLALLAQAPEPAPEPAAAPVPETALDAGGGAPVSPVAPAQAQAAPAPSASLTAPPTRTPGPAPTPRKARAPVEPATGEEERVGKAARRFFEALLQSDARSMTQGAVLPFFLEDAKLSTADDLLAEWLKHLRGKRADLLTLYGIEVVSPRQMEHRYGPPPQRLSAMPWRGADTFIAIANLSGHAAIAVFKRVGSTYRVAAYHD